MLKDIKETIKQLIEGIQDFVTQANADGLVIGLSGGVDSTLATWLGVQAVGMENVYGLTLPSGSESQLDTTLANNVAAWLGISPNTQQINIENGLVDLLDSFKVAPLPEYHKSSVAFKSRIRMAMLYYYAALLKSQKNRSYLVMGSCNRSERFIGYVTKYGDGGVDFEPLGGLLKTEIFEIARSISGFPKEVLDRPPSARVWVDDTEIDMSYRELDHLIENFEYVVSTEGLDAFQQMQGRRTSIPPSHVSLDETEVNDKRITYETLDKYISILLHGDFAEWRALDKSIRGQILDMNKRAKHKVEAPPIIPLIGGV